MQNPKNTTQTRKQNNPTTSPKPNKNRNKKPHPTSPPKQNNPSTPKIPVKNKPKQKPQNHRNNHNKNTRKPPKTTRIPLKTKKTIFQQPIRKYSTNHQKIIEKRSHTNQTWFQKQETKKQKEPKCRKSKNINIQTNKKKLKGTQNSTKIWKRKS